MLRGVNLKKVIDVTKLSLEELKGFLRREKRPGSKKILSQEFHRRHNDHSDMLHKANVRNQNRIRRKIAEQSKKINWRQK